MTTSEIKRLLVASALNLAAALSLRNYAQTTVIYIGRNRFAALRYARETRFYRVKSAYVLRTFAVLPLKKLAILSLQGISLISLVKTACVFFFLRSLRTNERRARHSPRTKLVRRIIVFHSRARMSSWLFQQRSPLLNARDYTHIYSRTKRDHCVMHTAPPSSLRGAHLHLKFTRLYVP